MPAPSDKLVAWIQPNMSDEMQQTGLGVTASVSSFSLLFNKIVAHAC